MAKVISRKCLANHARSKAAQSRSRVAAFYGIVVRLVGGIMLGLLFLVQSATQAVPLAPVLPVTDEPTVMIVELPRGARYAGLPQRCPGAPVDADPAEEVCFAELYQGPARMVRHLSGPSVERLATLRLTAHARRWRPGMRLMVATRPFEDGDGRGNFAVWWQLPEANGEFCQSVENLARWQDNPIRRQYLSGHLRYFRAQGYLESAEFRCIGSSARLG